MRLSWHFRILLTLSALALCGDTTAQDTGHQATGSGHQTTLSDLIQLGPGVEFSSEVMQTPVTGISSPSDHSVIHSEPEAGSTLAEQFRELRPAEDARPIRPKVLRIADEAADQLPAIAPSEDHTSPLFRATYDYPYGFTGPSGIRNTESQTSNHFIPVEDRWRLGQQDSDRYGKGHPLLDDYPGIKGAWWDPYNQNVLKGDFPIIGQHTFLNITAISETLFEARELPIPTTPFEATRNPGSTAFFGDPRCLHIRAKHGLGDRSVPRQHVLQASGLAIQS